MLPAPEGDSSTTRRAWTCTISCACRRGQSSGQSGNVSSSSCRTAVLGGRDCRAAGGCPFRHRLAKPAQIRPGAGSGAPCPCRRSLTAARPSPPADRALSLRSPLLCRSPVQTRAGCSASSASAAPARRQGSGHAVQGCKACSCLYRPGCARVGSIMAGHRATAGGELLPGMTGGLPKSLRAGLLRVSGSAAWPGPPTARPGCSPPPAPALRMAPLPRPARPPSPSAAV